jgi:hypothetical protein
MNPVNKAIADVKFKIPLDILNAAFLPRQFGQRPLPVNLDTLIRQKVFEPRVRVDCGLTGGNMISIPLGSITPEYVDLYNLIYKIPKQLTGNRSITKVLDLTVGYGSVMGTTNMGLEGASPMLDAMSGVIAAVSPIPIVSTAYVEIIAENTVLVSDTMQFPLNAYLRCMVDYDPDFTKLKPQTIPKFSKLVEFAVKAYIYNELIIPIGQGQLYGGMDLGKFKEIVETFSDANDNYETYLKDIWPTVAILDDTESRRRHLRLLTGGNN